MNQYIIVIVAFLLGQFVTTSVIVYNMQKKKQVTYLSALLAYLKAEIGWFIIGFAGICCIMFIMSDYVDLTIKKADLLNKENLSYKEKLIVYFKTSALFIGTFVQLIAFKFLKKGPEAIAKFDDKEIKLPNEANG